MKTEHLISALATGLEPVDRSAPLRAGALALCAGALLAGAMMFAWLGFNPALRAFLAEPMFWFKLGFGVALALSSLWLAAGLAQPGVRVSVRSWLPLLPVAVLWVLGAAALLYSAPEARAALIWGQTWRSCLLAIPLLAVPTLIGALLTLRRMAPTCPGCAGAAAGALASGVSCAVYALHCPELEAPFLAVWYVIGAAIPVLAGALLGRQLLRW